MSEIRHAAEEHLSMRRRLGCKLHAESLLLGHFTSFLEERGLDHVTIEAAVEWATLPPGADPKWQANRLSVVRGLARHLSAYDQRNLIPPGDLLPRRGPRTTPFLYSEQQIIALMRAARALPSPLRAATLEHFIGLMAAAGLRTGEALALDRDQADLTGGVLLIQGAKFGKSRLVPLHATAAARLRGYSRRRDQLCPHPSTPAFFITSDTARLTSSVASKAFNVLLTAAGVQAPPGVPRPRLYDLRHVYAVATLARWYAEGADVARHLPALSTAMGHVNPASTYWYLHACPQLMTAAAQRLDDSWKDPS
ncbi:MAG: tyrosine-type recombinase/integrase [Streptosporangiaceae bacterium]